MPNAESRPYVQRAADLRPSYTVVVHAQPSLVLDVFCPKCGYNLRGIDSERCPECAYSLAFLQVTESQIPWAHRKTIGRFRAYWRTVRTAIVRKKKFWEEISRPVSLRDAQKFRWITVLVAYLPLIPLSLVVVLDEPDAAISRLRANEPGIFVVGTIVFHLCAVLFLAGATGLPSYFFHPKKIPLEQQNRAVALSYYCCAPLAWLPVMCMPLFVGCLLIWFGMLVDDSLAEDCAAMAIIFWAMYFSLRIVIEWLLGLCWLHRRATGTETVRYGLFLALLPSLWLVLAGILLVGVPLIVGYVALVISSVW